MKTIYKPRFIILLIFLTSLLYQLSAQDTSYDFLKVYPVKQPEITDSVRTSNPLSQLTLTENQKEKLHLPEILKDDSIGLTTVYLAYKVNFPGLSAHSLVFHYFHGKHQAYSILVNYSLDYEFIEAKQISYHDDQKEGFKGEGKILKDRIHIYKHGKNHRRRQIYLFNADGGMILRVYKYPYKLIEEGKLTTIRIVSAQSGLNIRDSEGEKIGKFNFGEPVYIIEYSKDSTLIIDEGKRIWGRKAKVALDYPEYFEASIGHFRGYKKGYVFEGFLYKNGINYKDLSPNDPNYYYRTSGVNVSQPGYYSHFGGKIDIREFMKIEKVGLHYVGKILAHESIKQKQYNVSDLEEFTVKFGNGSNKIFKDTTFEDREYSPTNYFRLFSNPKLYGYYLIYNSFFEDSFFFILNKNTGNRVHTFEDYPFVSPNRKVAVSLRVPRAYDEGTAILEITEMNQGKFRRRVMAQFINWNIPNDREIYWLSDREFVIKAKEPRQSYYDEQGANFFYLKFTLKN